MRLNTVTRSVNGAGQRRFCSAALVFGPGVPFPRLNASHNVFVSGARVCLVARSGSNQVSGRRQSWGGVRRLASGRYRARNTVGYQTYAAPRTFSTKRAAAYLVSELCRSR